MLRPASERPSPDYALLVLSIEDGRQATSLDGILAVDGADLSEDQRKRIYVEAGTHRARRALKTGLGFVGAISR